MKTPESLEKNPSAIDRSHSKSAFISMREKRAIYALLQSDQWISRESIDRIAGASNGPQVIKNIRLKITGHDGIKMVQFQAIDRDGRLCRPGYYQLTLQGRERAMNYLEMNNGL